jgi:hypothetical protein
MSGSGGKVGAGKAGATSQEQVPSAGLPVQDAESRSKALAGERSANRTGPMHPLHWQHAQWLADRELDESWDKIWYQHHPEE